MGPQGKLSSKEERQTSVTLANSIAARLAYQASTASPGQEAAAAAAAAAAAVVNIDDDGDGVPDMAVPIVLALAAGGATPAHRLEPPEPHPPEPTRWSPTQRSPPARAILA